MDSVTYYLTQVLGLKEIIRPSSATLVVVLERALDSEEVALFGKMIQAMNLSNTQVITMDLESWNKEANQGEITIIFVNEPGKFSRELSPKTFVTFSPARLLKEPSLKKQAWEILKKAKSLLP